MTGAQLEPAPGPNQAMRGVNGLFKFLSPGYH